MIDFNFEYISKQLAQNQKLKALKGFHDGNVENMVNLINLIYRKHQQYHLGVSFIRIAFAKRVKVQKLLMIQNIIKRRSEDCFIKIKRFAVLKDKSSQIKAENKFNYPISILNRVFNNNRVNKLQEGWQKIVKYKSYMKIVENRLIQMEQVCDRYQQRILMRELFTVFRRVLDRKNDYFNHMLSFQKVFQILRVKRLFECLTQIVVRSETKVINQLQKQKVGKRDESVKANTKRIQLINDLKRKTNNMKGQVHQQTMRNNKKRTDGSRQNGTKLMKKNEQLRGIEMNMTQVLTDIQRMERQIARKQNFINNRPKVGIPFEFLRRIYLQFSDNQQEKLNKNQVESKIAKGKLGEFAISPNCITADNVKLKFIINLYQQFQTSKKSDSYLNLDNQNSSLKGIIGSLIRMQYFQPKREKIMKNIDQINTNFGQLKLQMSQLRVQKLQSRRK